MRTPLIRPLLALFALLAAAFGRAGTLTVTSPTDNGYLGLNNSVTFRIAGATSQVTVNLVYTAPGATSGVTLTTTVTPDNSGAATGSIPLNFVSGAKEGTYSLVVSATEANNTYDSTTLTETVDVTAPKFSELLPVTGGSTRGIVKVRATLEESNLKSWTVSVNYQGNTQQIASSGTQDPSLNVVADYDGTALLTDGSLTFTVTATDLAGNSASQTISLTLDRQKPTVSIVYPTNNGTVSGDLNVIVDITDASTTSVDRTGIDVIVKKTDGSYIGEVALISLTARSSTTQRWIGRLKSKKGLFPSTFLVTVNVVDRAGNVATPQQVTVKYRK